MTRTRTTLVVVAALVLSACATTPDTLVAGRADNDLLRFSAANYAIPERPLLQ